MGSDRGHGEGRLGLGYANAVVRLRWLIVLGWLGLVATSLLTLPGLSGSSAGAFQDLLPAGSPALTAQQRSLRSFAVPFTTGTVLVLHNPGGLSPLTLADVVLYALKYDAQLQGRQPPYPQERVLGALPIVDPRDTATALTYLYFSPDLSQYDQQRLSEGYAAHFRTDKAVRTYVTGLVPAESAEAGYLNGSLLLVEVCTLALVAVIVAAVFRSLLAPLLALSAAGLSFLADERLLGWVGRAIGIAVPAELSPLIVALLLGVLTDYTVFFLSGYHVQLAAGRPPDQAVRSAISKNAPIVTMAGVTVAAGCASLYVAPMRLFRAFGPGLAITILVGLITAVTLIPAMMALLGPRVFWPSRPGASIADRQRATGRKRSLAVAAVKTRFRAAVSAAACVAILAACALPLIGLRLSLSITATLPDSSPVRQGVDAMTTSFPRGSTSPTELLIEGRQVTQQRAALAAFQQKVAAQPGVAAVYGPANDPLPGAHDVVLSTGGNTARLVVVYDSDPLAASAITTLRTLQERGPRLARTAGLRDVRLAYAGGTATASEISESTLRNLEIILMTAFGVELVLLALFLRAAVAPLFLLASSALAIAAALGLTVLVFQVLLGVSGLTFYVPFASAVLLVSLGSDYNVFGVGRIWEEAADRPLPEALRIALPRSTRAITTAGVTLAGSFALVALVPLLTFTELAFAMGTGLLIDTFLVRSILTPALLRLVGTVSGWPGRRLRPAVTDHSAADAPSGLPVAHVCPEER